MNILKCLISSLFIMYCLVIPVFANPLQDNPNLSLVSHADLSQTNPYTLIKKDNIDSNNALPAIPATSDPLRGEVLNYIDTGYAHNPHQKSYKLDELIVILPYDLTNNAVMSAYRSGETPYANLAIILSYELGRNYHLKPVEAEVVAYAFLFRLGQEYQFLSKQGREVTTSELVRRVAYAWNAKALSPDNPIGDMQAVISQNHNKINPKNQKFQDFAERVYRGEVNHTSKVLLAFGVSHFAHTNSFPSYYYSNNNLIRAEILPKFRIAAPNLAIYNRAGYRLKGSAELKINPKNPELAVLVFDRPLSFAKRNNKPLTMSQIIKYKTIAQNIKG